MLQSEGIFRSARPRLVKLPSKPPSRSRFVSWACANPSPSKTRVKPIKRSSTRVPCCIASTLNLPTKKRRGSSTPLPGDYNTAHLRVNHSALRFGDGLLAVRQVALDPVLIVLADQCLTFFDQRPVADQERHALMQVVRLNVEDVAD